MSTQTTTAVPAGGAREAELREGGGPGPAPQPVGCTITRTVEWVDTDAAGHQHNSAILRWVEACEVELYRRHGLLDVFPRTPRVQQSVNYASRLWFGQQVSTTVTVDRIGRTSLALSFEIVGHAFETRPRTVAAHGSMVTAHIPAGSEKSAPWPAAVVEAFAPRQRP